MSLLKFVVLVVCVRTLHILHNGVIFERTGKMFLNQGSIPFIINVHRKVPKKALETVNLSNCPHKSNVSAIDSIDFTSAVMNLLQLEAQDLWFRGYTRNKRSFLGLILGTADFAWDALQQRQINDLKHLALESAKTADTLSKVVLENRNELTVMNEYMNHNFDSVRNAICRSSAAMRDDIIHTHAEEVAQNFLSQVESELATIIEGNIPTTLQYINLFSGICRRSCSELEKIQCMEYCKSLLSDMPSNMKPTLLKFIVGIDGVAIKLRLVLPNIQKNPKLLFTTYAVAIIKHPDTKPTKETANIPRFLIKIDDFYISVRSELCEDTRHNMICPNAALILPSCFDDCTCPTFERKTHDRCEYTYTSTGVVVSALGNVTVTTADETLPQAVPSLTSGLFYISSSNKTQTISCEGQTILLPALKHIVTVNVTFETVDTSLPFDVIEPLNISHHIQHFSKTIKELKSDHELLAKRTFHGSLLLTGLIMFMLIIIIGLIIYIMIRFRSQNESMRSMHNNLLPSL